jgi:hypothetical protein
MTRSYLSDCRLSRWFVDVGSIADVSDIHDDSIFMYGVR